MSRQMMGMRVYFAVRGGHTHLNIFTGRANDATMGKAGSMTMTNEEFAAWREGRMEIAFKGEADCLPTCSLVGHDVRCVNYSRPKQVG